MQLPTRSTRRTSLPRFRRRPPRRPAAPGSELERLRQALRTQKSETETHASAGMEYVRTFSDPRELFLT